MIYPVHLYASKKKNERSFENMREKGSGKSKTLFAWSTYVVNTFQLENILPILLFRYTQLYKQDKSGE